MKNTSFKLLTILLIVILLTGGCTSTRKIMESWMGHDKSEIIRSWGPPSGGIVSDGKGGEILLYNYERTLYTPVYGNIMSRNINDYKQIYCDPNGKIYYMRWGRQ